MGISTFWLIEPAIRSSKSTLPKLIRFHLKSGGFGKHGRSSESKYERRYGTVQMDAGGRVTGFAEKNGAMAAGFVNAGFMSSSGDFELIPERPASLEEGYLPKIGRSRTVCIRAGWSFHRYRYSEDLRAAQELCDRLYAAASRDYRSAILNRNLGEIYAQETSP